MIRVLNELPESEGIALTEALVGGASFNTVERKAIAKMRSAGKNEVLIFALFFFWLFFFLNKN